MTDLWENLKSTKSNILLYGMGNGADKIIKVLEKNNIEFKGIFASDGFQKEGKTFHGFPILTLSDFEEKFSDITVLLCFGSARTEVIENVKKIKTKHTLFAPDVPVYGDILFDKDFYENTKARHDKIYNLLADDVSKNTFENTVKYKLSGDVDYLFSCETPIAETYNNILNLSDNETYLDLGAYTGDTVKEFLSFVPSYNKILAVEPDKKTFSKLKNNTSELENIILYNNVISDKCGVFPFAMNGSRGSNSNKDGNTTAEFITADKIAENEKITYIKADVEGAELSFIKGAEKTILRDRPKMQIACYHRSEDLITIPEAVLSIRNDYKVYMRHFSSLPAWDTVYYFI